MDRNGQAAHRFYLYEKTKNNFNAYILSYSSSGPLRGLISYNRNGNGGMEEFFLEAGDKKTFFSFIDGYLSGETGDPGEIYITLESITGEDLTFESHGFDTRKEPVIAKETCYIENDRFRLGIELAWGGGLSFLQDKKCPAPGVGNLLNRYDTGRLVQQSYYGTREAPYAQGTFMDRPWCYNPVQGGDRGMKKSKLVEVRVSEKEIYVKARPRDWGHDGGLTFSYMENRYQLEEKGVRVYNRFTDFSGWMHPECTQELPAFYTLSYFGNYYWYDGSRPWTDDTLSCRDDLPFWDGHWDQCRFEQREGSCEYWGAFTDEHGYGVGLFCPAADRWIAGRFRYDGTKDANASPTNYIAPTRLMALKSFCPITYEYYLSVGTLPELRETFRQCRETIRNESLKNY